MVKRTAAKEQQARKRKRPAPEGPKDDPNLNLQNEVKPDTTKGPSKAANSFQKPLTFANGVNPLHIDHILEKVLQYAIMPTATQKEQKTHADHETARSIRLVSRRWNETATKFYRKARGPKTFSSDDGIEMKSFLDIMKNSSLIPAEKYAIRCNFLLEQKNQKRLKDFMRICGPSTTELHLTYDLRNAMNFNPRMFLNLNLLKLQSLHVHLDYSGLEFSNDFFIMLNQLQIMQGALDNNFKEFHKLVKVLHGAAHHLQKFHVEKKFFDEVRTLIRASESLQEEVI